MKKILMSALAVMFCANAMALDYEPREGVTTTAFLGLNVTNIRNTNYDAKAGGVLGVKFDYVLPNAHGTYITAGLDWTIKGARLSNNTTVNGNNVEATDKMKLHYIEIPVRVGFRYNLDKQLGFYGEFGPYFAVGTVGKHKYSIDADGTQWADQEYSYKVFKKSTSRENFQRWDAGLGFRIGAEYNQHYNLSLGCDWGLTDMWRDNYRDAIVDAGGFVKKVKNLNFTIALGYRF